jgi:type IV pilus assembly protein PilA
MRKDMQGFSWIEIIIVVVVIVLSAGIVIPNLWKSKTDIDDASAIRSIRTIVLAEKNYAQSYDKGYSSSLATMGMPPDAMPSASRAGFIDSELAAGVKEGYAFNYQPGPVNENGRIQTYTLTVSPTKPGSSGNTYYFVDQTGVIRENTSHVATAADSPFGG